MPRHRFQAEPEPLRLPQPPAPGLNPSAVVLWPLDALGSHPQQLLWQISLYQWAFAQAQAVARPSILERNLLAVWN
jgi:hypothetical protein